MPRAKRQPCSNGDGRKAVAIETCCDQRCAMCNRPACECVCPPPVLHALVGGWGAVEQQAESWSPGATIQEVEPRLWVVQAVTGAILGVIGKEPWTAEAVEREADALYETACVAAGVR